MDDANVAFRVAVGSLASQWIASGLPSRQALDDAADNLVCLRERLKVDGIWDQPPSMVTATLDDGLGQGLAVIEKYAVAVGIRLISLGLMQKREAVIEACRHNQPDFLGLTILQFDSEDDLRCIANHLPRKTRIVAGGPVFDGDPDFADRTGTHYAAKNVADFLWYLLQTPYNSQT